MKFTIKSDDKFLKGTVAVSFENEDFITREVNLYPRESITFNIPSNIQVLVVRLKHK